MKEETTILRYKNILQSKLLLCVRNRDKLCYLQGLLNTFFCFSAEMYSTGGPQCAAIPMGCQATRRRWWLQAESNSRPTDSHCQYLAWAFAYITHSFPFNHVTAFAYFHRCVLCRESLIDSSVKGQHATVGQI